MKFKKKKKTQNDKQKRALYLIEKKSFDENPAPSPVVNSVGNIADFERQWVRNP